MADPTLPDTVEYEEGTFLNAQGLQLRTYRFSPKGRAARGVIWLCHGYASWTNFEWMLASEPGGSHTVFEDSVPGGLVAAGFTVATLDHQSHGRSEGDQGLRCFFNRFDDLADECLDCLSKLREEDATLDTLPVFLFGISMGGATAVRMAQKQPTLFRGAVLYAPMLSLEEVQKQSIFLCVTNRHLAPLVEVLNKLIPKVPLAKPARNTIHPKSQEEMDADPLTYSENARVRVAREFFTVTNWFMAGGLAEMRTPFVTFHSVKDTFTDPLGSETLVRLAEVKDKTYVRVGKGLDLEADIWHALTFEPGHELVFARALAWIEARVA